MVEEERDRQPFYIFTMIHSIPILEEIAFYLSEQC